MDLRQHLNLMAGYHPWAFGRLYEQVDLLSEAEYRGDCDLHFKSIHGTLAHLLLVDLLWQCRMEHRKPDFPTLEADIEPDRDRLRERLLTQAGGWPERLAATDDEALSGDLSFRNLAGDAFTLPLACLISHVFNHGTHHRGQVSAALTGFGRTAPVMDFPYYLRELTPRQLHG